MFTGVDDHKDDDNDDDRNDTDADYDDDYDDDHDDDDDGDDNDDDDNDGDNEDGDNDIDNDDVQQVWYWPYMDNIRMAKVAEFPKVSTGVIHGIEEDKIYKARVLATNDGGDGKKTPPTYFTLGESEWDRGRERGGERERGEREREIERERGREERERERERERVLLPSR